MADIVKDPVDKLLLSLNFAKRKALEIVASSGSKPHSRTCRALEAKGLIMRIGDAYQLTEQGVDVLQHYRERLKGG